MDTTTAAIELDTSAEVRRLKTALALTRHDYHELLGAARAAVAAAARGDVDPLVWVSSELAAHGQLPANGIAPERVAADTAWAIREDRRGAYAEWIRT
jgi:hypothetical protein